MLALGRYSDVGHNPGIHFTNYFQLQFECNGNNRYSFNQTLIKLLLQFLHDTIAVVPWAKHFFLQSENQELNYNEINFKLVLNCAWLILSEKKPLVHNGIGLSNIIWYCEMVAVIGQGFWDWMFNKAVYLRKLLCLCCYGLLITTFTHTYVRANPLT